VLNSATDSAADSACGTTTENFIGDFHRTQNRQESRESPVTKKEGNPKDNRIPLATVLV
jgi:hypothetical protein